MQKETIRVNGKDGLHARPAAEFVQLCKNIKSNVKLEKNGVSVSGKSIIGIMSLGISGGDEVTVVAEGDDEVDAIILIKELLDKE
ncbi:MAG TPA: HPr family phosphocarrier protein [Clostridia bacterium]|nr:HPr family phosphocarrier protein [Clostridia bacterium]